MLLKRLCFRPGLWGALIDQLSANGQNRRSSFPEHENHFNTLLYVSTCLDDFAFASGLIFEVIS